MTVTAYAMKSSVCIEINTQNAYKENTSGTAKNKSTKAAFCLSEKNVILPHE